MSPQTKPWMWSLEVQWRDRKAKAWTAVDCTFLCPSRRYYPISRTSQRLGAFKAVYFYISSVWPAENSVSCVPYPSQPKKVISLSISSTSLQGLASSVAVGALVAGTLPFHQGSAVGTTPHRHRPAPVCLRAAVPATLPMPWSCFFSNLLQTAIPEGWNSSAGHCNSRENKGPHWCRHPLTCGTAITSWSNSCISLRARSRGGSGHLVTSLLSQLLADLPMAEPELGGLGRQEGVRVPAFDWTFSLPFVICPETLFFFGFSLCGNVRGADRAVRSSQERPPLPSAAAGDGGLLWDRGPEHVCQNRTSRRESLGQRRCGIRGHRSVL